MCSRKEDLIGAWAYSMKNYDLPTQSRHCPETRQSSVPILPTGRSTGIYW